MPLKVELKPHERIIVGACVITNTAQPTYFSLVRDILLTMPSAWPFIESVNTHILNGDTYLALKDARKLIAHEGDVLAKAAVSGAQKTA